MNYSTFIKEKLVFLINEMDQYHWLFTRNAEKDFSRIKKWSFGEIMRFIISMEGKSLKDELLEHFIHICRFFLSIRKEAPPDVESLISRELLPVRPGRSDPRKVKFQSAVSFLYRVA